MKFRTRADTALPQVKSSRRLSRPDLSLLLLRLIVLGAGAAVFFDSYSRGGAARDALKLGVFPVLLILVFSLRKVKEWERAVVLRCGKFRKVRGPGFFFLIPLLDEVFKTVDIRIRVTDFYAQETLTGDSVSVGVDAFCFWLVWDPQKAALEVENYEEAVALASKAALRNVIAKNDLSAFLACGDLIEKQIQEEVEKQTTEWGITVHYVEITDIQIPEKLQNSLSRMAQAEREKKARILLAEAEIEIAKKLEEAVLVYGKNEDAMKLKILSILNEGLKAGNSMMLVPNSISEELKTKDIFGLEALKEIKRQKASPAGKGGKGNAGKGARGKEEI